ncbi:hypothetical protein D3C85_1428050 [compost metagenome]
MAIHAGTDFGEEIEILGGARDELLAGLRNRQARVLRLKVGQTRHVLVDQLAQAAHQAGAFPGRRVGPIGKGAGRCGHGGVDLGRAACRHFVDGVAGGRVVGDEAVPAVDLLAIDPVLDAHAWLLACAPGVGKIQAHF